MMSDAFRFRNDGGEEQRRTDGLTGALRCMAEPQMNEGPGNVSVGRSGEMVGRADGVPPKRTTIAVQQGQRIAEG